MAQKRMKLSQFAKDQDIAYATAYRHWQAGHIKGIQLPGGTILVEGWEDEGLNDSKDKQLAIIYSRVSSTTNSNKQFKTRTPELTEYALEQGYEIIDTIEEIATAFSDKRIKLLNILHRTDWDVLVAEDEGQIFKFGYPYIEVLLKQSGREIQLMKNTSNDEEDGDEEITNGEYTLVSLFRKMQAFMHPIIGSASSKRQIEEDISSLLR